LDDAVRREIECRRERSRRALDRHDHVESCLAHLAHERVEPVEPRLGREVRTVAAHVSEQLAELGQGAASGRLDAAESLARTVGPRLEDVVRGRRLHDHHAQVVRDDVVQLARDARLFLGNCARGLALPLALEPLGLLLELPHVPAPDADAVAEEPGDGERQEPTEHQVRMAPAGICPEPRSEDDERAPAGRERKPTLEPCGDGEERNSRREGVVRIAADGDRGDDGRHRQHRKRVTAPEEERQSEQKRDRHADRRPTLVAKRAERRREREQHKRQVAQALVPLEPAPDHG
jgi:hypothetical protein